MSKKSPMHTDEQLLALTALAAKDPAPLNPCPPDEQLAAFIDGQLRGNARDEMLAHLNQCDTCRQHWLEVATLVSAEDSKQSPATPQSNSLLTNLLGSLKFLFAPRGFALAATAAAAITLVVNLPLTPDLTERVDQQFAAANPDAKALVSVAQSMPLPWESAALGFGEQSIATANRAFGAGVWEGRATLGGAVPDTLPDALTTPDRKAWSETTWNPYYQFGRWAVLLWAQLSAEQEIEHWDEHLKIIGDLRLAISATEPDTGIAQRALTALDKQLATLADAASDGDTRDLRQRLFLTIQQLAPAVL